MKIEEGAIVTPSVRLLRPLGEGGMGAVWVAEHTGLGTEVAVKFLQGDYAQDPNARSRFSQEAAAASQVKSSHVVKVYDYGITSDDVPFIVMEMLEGTDLSKRMMVERRIPPLELLVIITQLCKALERAHEKGVIHRDIKPENVFLGSEGGEIFVKLLDFGIAKTETLLRKTTGNRQSTMAGESLGTPFYMSPEQFRSAKQIDPRSDLWSVGVVVYEALTGELPFVADTVGALAIIVNDGVAVPPTKVNSALPESIDAWFAKACARDPKDRFPSARELAKALAIALGESPRAPTISLTSEIDPSASGSQRIVIAHGVVTSDERASLRDTAFATTGGGRGTPRAKPVAFGAVGVALLLIVAFVVVKTMSSRAHPSVEATKPTIATETPHVVVTTPAAAASALTIAPEPVATTAVATTATHAPTAGHTTAVASAIATPHASASASSGKGDHHDIW